MDSLPVPGTPIDELDTPTLLIDLPVMERNIERLHGFFRQRPARVRPHVKVHKSPDVARLQLAAAGTVGGVCVAKVGEAEVMVRGGISQVLIANQVVGQAKMPRLMALARQSDLTVCVDSAENVRELSEAARAFGATLGCLVEVNVGLNRCGVEPGQPALELARLVARSPGLRLAGLMGYEGGMQVPDSEERATEARRRIRRLLDTREALERAGLAVGVVSAGGTATYNITGAMEGITEVQAGGYVLMDTHFRYVPDFDIALHLLATVMSRPTRDRAVIDAGHKAAGLNYTASVSGSLPGFTGLPEVAWPPGACVSRLNAEHGILRLEGADARQLRVGDRIPLFPAYAEAIVNQHDYFVGVRGGVVEAVWPIAARGAFR